MQGYGQCPRCGSGCMEYLATHAHCWACNYFPEDAIGARDWLDLEFGGVHRPQIARAHEDTRMLHGHTPLAVEVTQ